MIICAKCGKHLIPDYGDAMTAHAERHFHGAIIATKTLEFAERVTCPRGECLKEESK